MKNVYIVYFNRYLGSRHWVMDKIFISEKRALQYLGKISKKFPKGIGTIEKERVYN